VFGGVTFAYWLFFAGHAPGLASAAPWLWAGGVAVMVITSMLVNRRLPRSSGAASRAVAAAWSGTGASLIAPCLGLILGGERTGQPQLVLWIFPVIMFTLYGAAWTVAWAVKRRAWLFLVGAGCFATALAEGALVSSPHQWLVLAAGLALWVALPGAVILRQARPR